MTTWKPQSEQPPTAGHPLAPDLFCQLFGELRGSKSVDLVNGRFATPSSSNSLLAAGAPCQADNSYWQLPFNTRVNSPRATLVCRARIDVANSLGSSWLICRNYDGVIAYALVAKGDGANFGGMSFFDGGWHRSGPNTNVIGDGLWHTFVGTYDGSTLKYYIDGRLDASTAYTGSLPTSSTQPVDFGAYRNDGAMGGMTIDFAYGFRRALTEEEVRTVSGNPFVAWEESDDTLQRLNQVPIHLFGGRAA